MENPPDHPDRMVLHIQRLLDGRVTSCRMVLQKVTGFVFEETCTSQHPTTTQPVPAHVITPTAHDQAALNADARRTRLFHEEAPCWFEGCAQLRAQYFEDISQLDADCLPCEQGQIMRRYLAHMATLGV